MILGILIIRQSRGGGRVIVRSVIEGFNHISTTLILKKKCELQYSRKVENEYFTSTGNSLIKNVEEEHLRSTRRYEVLMDWLSLQHVHTNLRNVFDIWLKIEITK